MSITPGPWAAIPDSREDSEGDWYVHAPDEEVVTFGLSEPDAALIAAAPDLLAVAKNLRHALAWHCRDGHGPVAMDEEFLRVANAAIAKAEGTS